MSKTQIEKDFKHFGQDIQGGNLSRQKSVRLEKVESIAEMMSTYSDEIHTVGESKFHGHARSRSIKSFGLYKEEYEDRTVSFKKLQTSQKIPDNDDSKTAINVDDPESQHQIKKIVKGAQEIYEEDGKTKGKRLKLPATQMLRMRERQIEAEQKWVEDQKPMMGAYKGRIFNDFVFKMLQFVIYSILLAFYKTQLDQLDFDHNELFIWILINIILLGIEATTMVCGYSWISLTNWRAWSWTQSIMNLLIAYFGIWGFVIMFHTKTKDLFNHKHTALQEATLCHNCTEYGALEIIIWAMVLTRVIPVFCGIFCCLALCFGCCFVSGFFIKASNDKNVEGFAPELKMWVGKQEKKKNDATCAICCKNFLDEPDKHICQLECSNKHIFHVDCLTEWIEQGHDDCPICHEKIDRDQLYADEETGKTKDQIENSKIQAQ